MLVVVLEVSTSGIVSQCHPFFNKIYNTCLCTVPTLLKVPIANTN